MTTPLEGRTALVTGASRRAGIGFATAHLLASRGAHIAVQGCVRQDAEYRGGSVAEAAEPVVSELRGLDPDVVYLDADLADPAAAGRIVSAAAAARGPLDILVASHARSVAGSLDEVTAQELDLSFAVNARGSVLLAQAFAAQYEGPRGGRIVLITSGQGGSAMPSELAYAVSKGAIHQMTRSLAAHLMSRGITVNTINPGPTETGWADKAIRAEVADIMPTGRWGFPSDAAQIIALLCSDDAAWVTGQVIDADGGFSL